MTTGKAGQAAFWPEKNDTTFKQVLTFRGQAHVLGPETAFRDELLSLLVNNPETKRCILIHLTLIMGLIATLSLKDNRAGEKMGFFYDDELSINPL